MSPLRTAENVRSSSWRTPDLGLPSSPIAGKVSGVPDRTVVSLPTYVQRPYEVYVNGVAQAEGSDFQVIGSRLVFERSFAQAPRLALWRWIFILTIGLVVGGYDAHDTIDVVYTRAGRRTVASLRPEGAGARRQPPRWRAGRRRSPGSSS